jgi:hypothetical protein
MTKRCSFGADDHDVELQQSAFPATITSDAHLSNLRECHALMAYIKIESIR